MNICVVGGFCEVEPTNSTLYGLYNWPETGGSQTATLQCFFGAPFGIGTANATRLCMSGGTWSEPDFSACRSSKLTEMWQSMKCATIHLNPYFIIALPEVVIPSGALVTVEIGRSVSISCDVTSVNGGDQVAWYKLEGGLQTPG